MRYLQWFNNGLIILLNYVLRYVIIKLQKLRGNKTRSEETLSIMTWIMIVQFLNTGPFLLMINSDLRGTGIPLLGDFISKGKHSDFTRKWYNDIG
jgi:hypothetical protein